ncbi:MAG: hypothetical protein WD118_11485 [Phycisphaeraceae bacterium]
MANQVNHSEQSGSQSKADAAPTRRATFGTPTAIVVLGLLLWVLGAAAAAGAQILLFNGLGAELSVPMYVVTVYLLYAPSVLLSLLGTVALVVAAVRWGMYGRRAVGVPNRDSIGQAVELLGSINQRLLLSEAAKRIAYRQQDLHTLRLTINDDIDNSNFDAALVLVSELGQTYGYREEAETYRERINHARAAEQDAKISESLARLDEILARHDFERAVREAAKMQRLFPESERVRDLTTRVREARDRYKVQLEREFLEASERDDIDRAMEVLKTMDRYLTEAEAAPLRETARGVIGKKRDNLGVQFKIALHDKEWTAAVRVGEQIIREFPNSRMAEEVRSMIDLLRERAAGQQAVHAR